MKTFKIVLVILALFTVSASVSAQCPCGASCKCSAGQCGSPDCPPLRATIVVHLPADAVLSFGGERTASAGSRRTFASPALVAGRIYEYKLTASVIRNGEIVKLEKTVTVKAGQTTQVTMELPELAIDFAPMRFMSCVGGT